MDRDAVSPLLNYIWAARKSAPNKRILIAYIKGSVAELNPAYVLVEAQGLGYHVHISLNTYSALQGKRDIKLFTHHFVKADKSTNIPVLFGFAEEIERALFEKLTSVSGVGPNTARMILSSYAPMEINDAIVQGNVALLKSIKGVGPKAAQRLILELKDKLNLGAENAGKTLKSHNTTADEALTALVMLGFNRSKAQGAVNQALSNNPNVQEVEVLIKEALKIL